MNRLLSIIAFLALAFVAGARNYALLVGIADYPGTTNDLRISAADAVTMKALFDKHGDAVTTVLTDEQATVDAVKAAMGKLFSQANEDDAVVMFFSGHGVPGGFVCHNGLLRYDDITTAMMASAAHVKMVWADACYSGKARKTNRRSYKPSETNVMFFLSSRTNEKSIERRGWKNSIFTAYLERGLRGGADVDRDRTITAHELFDFVSQGVAKDSYNKQHPVMWGHFDNAMPVIKW